jgi:FKBP-type peptidyl-prolyl cis-trans isomerase 2
MHKIPEGARVTISVTARSSQGELEKDAHYTFIIGEGEILPFIEDAVRKMQRDSQVTFTVREPFGEKDPNLLSEIPLSFLEKSVDPKVGMHLEILDEDEQPLIVTITNIFQDKILVDANHPLAGETVNYTIKLLDVEI